MLADGLAGGLQPVLDSAHHHSSKVAPWVIQAGWSAVVVLGISLFIWLFWKTTLRAERGIADTTTHLLLAIQSVLMLAINQELIHLIAMELPLVLPLRVAVGWAVGSVLAMAGTTLATVTFAGDGVVPAGNIGHLPFGWQVTFTTVTMLAWGAFAFSAGCLAGIERRNRREVARLNAEMAAAQQLLAHDSRLAERVHIARELHDELGHHLIALRLHLDLAAQVAPECSSAAPIAQARDIAGAMVRDVRRVVGSMRRDRPIDIAAALRRMVDGIAEPTVHLSMPPNLTIESTAHVHVVFRAVQEAITNTLRHANASTMWVDLAADGGEIRLTIRDDGDGVASVHPGNGLTGMRERVSELGGAIRIGSRPGRGFSLSLQLPLTTGVLA